MLIMFSMGLTLSLRDFSLVLHKWTIVAAGSLRRTKPAIIYKQTGNLRAVQILLGHTKIETTVR
jgi:site-specific recombinase XerC